MISMNVVHVTEFFSPLSETFIYNYVTALQDCGHRSHVFTLHRVNVTSRPYNAITEITLPSRWNYRRAYAGLSRRVGLLEVQEQLFDIAREQLHDFLVKSDPDIVHAHFGPMGVMAASVTRDLGIPLVVSFLGYDGSQLLRSVRWRHAYRKLNRDASAVIGISSDMCNRLEEIGFEAKRIHRIHLGVHIDDFTDITSTSVAQNETLQIRCLHVGRLTQKKSPLKLLDVFALARMALLPSIDLSLSIIGDGELFASLCNKIESHQLSKSVQVLRAVEHSTVIQMLQNAHIYTQYCETAPNGDVEGLGVSFVEASASGLPIVSTRHGGIPDVVVDGQTGFLVEENDISGMANRIIQLARQPHLRFQMGRAGRKHVEANFSLSRQIMETVNLYQNLITENTLPKSD